MPFTPLRRDNMIAWLAARSDGPAYGRLVAFLLPEAASRLRAAAGRGPRRPGRRDLPADHPVEPAGIDRPSRQPAGGPGGGLARLRAAALPGRREGIDPGAEAGHRRLRQPDRDGRDLRRLPPVDLRAPARAVATGAAERGAGPSASARASAVWLAGRGRPGHGPRTRCGEGTGRPTATRSAGSRRR